MNRIGQKVVVTTEFRGVFFGTVLEYEPEKKHIVLTNARNCLRWTSANRGFLGLATDGPKAGSRVGPSVLELDLAGVTSVSVCTNDAIKLWEGSPWD